MNERMKHLNKLVHYSTGIKITLPTEFIDKNIGYPFNHTDELQESLEHLQKDGRLNVIVTSDKENTTIDIKVEK